MDISLLSDTQIWLLVVGFIIAFALAFGIGANDVANSFGTSVGSRVLTLKQACILATICETLGAILLGSKVSDTIRKGITDTEPFNSVNGTMVNGTSLFMIGQVSALTGSCVWLIIATTLSVPVSGTHSIVGATIGFSLVCMGGYGVQWKTLIKIIGSWFISPALSGLVSVLLFFFLRKAVLEKEDPLEPGLRLLPMAYAVTVCINLLSIFFHLPKVFGVGGFPPWAAYPLSCGISIILAIIIKLVIVPWRRVRIMREVANESAQLVAETLHKNNNKPKSLTFPRESSKRPLLDPTPTSEVQEVEEEPAETQTRFGKLKVAFSLKSNGNVTPNRKESESEGKVASKDMIERLRDRPEQAKLLSWLQILTAIFGSFAHGGNDVSNAIGPLVGLWLTAERQQVVGKAMTPIWILLYGGAGISIGLWAWGRRVIKTLGNDLTLITPSSGLCIELGAASTVLLASNIGIPISTTHCKVGSVVAVGYFRSRDNVNWRIFRNILLAWGVTLPISGGLSALIFYITRSAIGI